MGTRNNHSEERAMTNPSHLNGSVREALRDAVLALGGMVAVHQPGEDLGDAVARALRGVVRRHLPAGAGMSSTRLRPHPAIAQLLDQIGAAPDIEETPASSGADHSGVPQAANSLVVVEGVVRLADAASLPHYTPETARSTHGSTRGSALAP